MRSTRVRRSQVLRAAKRSQEQQRLTATATYAGLPPGGIMFLAGWMAVMALAIGAIAATAVFTWLGDGDRRSLVLSAVLAPFAGFYVAAAIGLWRGGRWAWGLAMFMWGGHLLGGLASLVKYSFSGPMAFGILVGSAFNLLVVSYLFHSDVRDHFDLDLERASTIALICAIAAGLSVFILGPLVAELRPPAAVDLDRPVNVDFLDDVVEQDYWR